MAKVVFKHREDLFSSSVVKSLEMVNDFSLEVDSSLLYSGVNVGYEKQDYDNENTGNDEWNFENIYMTGLSLKESKLELMCPYRADCYGMEELVGKRSEEESTDKDEDVFIVKVLSAVSDGHWKVDRSVSVDGTYTDTVFNAVFAPIYMVEANKSYLASFCKSLKLSMTRGCRDVVIGGVPVIRDFDFLSDGLFKCGKVSVVTGDLSLPEDKDGVVEFVWDGYRYKGFIGSIEQKCQREEPVKYELIEISQEACI